MHCESQHSEGKQLHEYSCSNDSNDSNAQIQDRCPSRNCENRRGTDLIVEHRRKNKMTLFMTLCIIQQKEAENFRQ